MTAAEARDARSRIERTARKVAVRALLLALAESFGAADARMQRQLAARFWRLLPRDCTPEEALDHLAARLTDWSADVTGRRASLAELRAAFLRAGADPGLLLLPNEKLGALATGLLLALPRPVPLRETPLGMPVQSLRPLTFARLFEVFSPVASPVPVPVRVRSA